MTMSTLAHIESEHARIGAVIEEFKKQSVFTEYIVERAVIPLAPGARLAGPIFKDDGTLDYYLILHAGEGKGSHGVATDYAADRGLKLPNRREGRLLQAAFPEECAKGSIWLEEEHEDDPSYAWCQHYYDGSQYSLHKSVALRAVAVSRFIPSVI